jgi:hypothetical protein
MEWSMSNDWDSMVTRAVYGYCADTKERMESMKVHCSAHMSRKKIHSLVVVLDCAMNPDGRQARS